MLVCVCGVVRVGALLEHFVAPRLHLGLELRLLRRGVVPAPQRVVLTNEPMRQSANEHSGIENGPGSQPASDGAQRRLLVRCSIQSAKEPPVRPSFGHKSAGRGKQSTSSPRRFLRQSAIGSADASDRLSSQSGSFVGDRERHHRPTYSFLPLMLTSSTSKMRSAPGGMSAPAPRSPYLRARHTAKHRCPQCQSFACFAVH